MAKANFTNTDIRNHLNRGAQIIEQKMIYRLKVLGEQCVNIARTNGSYNNITGNLRSSLGYVILKHGQIIDENFEQSGNGSEGLSTAKSYASELAAKFPKGFVLLVFAGMGYAQVLEARGQDVLTSAELFAEQQLPGILAKIRADVKKS